MTIPSTTSLSSTSEAAEGFSLDTISVITVLLPLFSRRNLTMFPTAISPLSLERGITAPSPGLESKATFASPLTMQVIVPVTMSFSFISLESFICL